MGSVHLLYCKLLRHLLLTYLHICNANSGNSGSLFLKIKNSEFYGEQEKETIIC